MTSNKKTALSLGLNLILVGAALWLVMQLLSPEQSRERITSITRIGELQTELAAERLLGRITVLREELKENALRLVDDTRGPVFLDPARCLWMRVQDKDWRAQNFLDGLPTPRTDVDKWSINSAKNSFVLSQRVPIVKDGRQDFVLIEGGLKLTVFNDLQSDDRFGLWVFDLNSYKKNGLSGAKIYERMSANGSLGKNEMSAMTSEILPQIFAGREPIELHSENPWFVFFKRPVGSDSIGVLGYWSKSLLDPGANFSLLPLLGILTLLGGLFTFFQVKLLDTGEEGAPIPASGMPLSPAPMAPVPGFIQSSAPGTNSEFKNFAKHFVREASGNSSEVQATELQKARSILDHHAVALENVDFEILFRNYCEQPGSLSRIDTYFDPELWRVLSDQEGLRKLLDTCVLFLEKSAENPQLRPRLAAKYYASDAVEVGSEEIKISPEFRTPFVRIVLQVKAARVFPKVELKSFFEFTPNGPTFENLALRFTPDLVDLLHARLLVRSDATDGLVIYLDLPATEPRRAEDAVYIQQLRSVPAQPPEPAPSDLAPPVVTETKKAKSFAEDISDDRSRVRSRFKIRRPGEKRMNLELQPNDFLIFVVENDEKTRNYLVDAFKQWGFQVSSFVDGDACLVEMQKNNLPHVLFAGIEMSGLSGLGLAKRAKELSQEIEIVLMTDSPTMDSALEALRLNVHDYLLKPFTNLDDVKNVIFHVCERIYLRLYTEYLVSELKIKNEEIRGLASMSDELTNIVDITKTIEIGCRHLSGAFKGADVCFLQFLPKDMSLTIAARYPEGLFGGAQSKLLLPNEVTADLGTIAQFFSQLETDPRFGELLENSQSHDPRTE